MNNITVPAPLIRAAQACQAKKDIRYYLNGILIAGNGDIVGTDGHAAFKGNCPEAFFVDDNDLPVDMIIDINGKIPANAKTVRFEFDNPATSGMAITDNGKVFTFTVIDGTYPQYDRVIPKPDRLAHSTGFAVNASLIAKVEQCFGKGSCVVFRPATENDCILVEYEGKGAGKFEESLVGSVMAIMPMRSSFTFYPLFTHAPQVNAA